MAWAAPRRRQPAPNQSQTSQPALETPQKQKTRRTAFMAPCLTPRTATLPSSPMPDTVLASALRRSAVSGGIAMRTLLPSLDGLAPRSAALNAFSTDVTAPLSYTETSRVAASGAETEARDLRGVGVP